MTPLPLNQSFHEQMKLKSNHEIAEVMSLTTPSLVILACYVLRYPF